MQFNDLGKQWQTIRESVLEKIDKLGHEGSYINGKSVTEFEQQFKHYNNETLIIQRHWLRALDKIPKHIFQVFESSIHSQFLLGLIQETFFVFFQKQVLSHFLVKNN